MISTSLTSGVSHPTNVLGRVRVALVFCFALGAGPAADVQRQVVYDVTARGAAFTAGEEAVDQYDGTPGHLSLVLHQSEEFTPSGIRDGQSDVAVADHVLHCQRLEAKDLVFVHKLAGQLVQEVSALVRNLGVDAGHLASGLLPVPASLLLPAQASLRPLEATEALAEMPGVAAMPHLPVAAGCDDEIVQAKVNTDTPIQLRQGFSIYLNNKGDVVPPGRVKRHGAGRGL